jgi:hypothetical protein
MAPHWPPKMGREGQTRNGDTLAGAPFPSGSIWFIVGALGEAVVRLTRRPSPGT